MNVCTISLHISGKDRVSFARIKTVNNYWPEHNIDFATVRAWIAFNNSGMKSGMQLWSIDYIHSVNAQSRVNFVMWAAD